VSAPKAQLAAADLATFFLAGVAGVAAGNLTYLALMNPDRFLEPLRVALSPGLYTVWLMAGDANGYVTPEGWILVVAVFLNALVYASALMVPRLLWCHVTSRHALRPQA
jgi:hypothetical protein